MSSQDKKAVPEVEALEQRVPLNGVKFSELRDKTYSEILIFTWPPEKL